MSAPEAYAPGYHEGDENSPAATSMIWQSCLQGQENQRRMNEQMWQNKTTFYHPPALGTYDNPIYVAHYR